MLKAFDTDRNSSIPGGQGTGIFRLTLDDVRCLLQSFSFRNNGPIVEMNGSMNRTVWFEVEDENGGKVIIIHAGFF